MNDEPLPPVPPPRRIKGRGAASNREGRFETRRAEWADDGWYREDDLAPPHRATTVTEERARSIISTNDSPDIAFDQSINPYRGCEHGCVYCYARPSHGFLNLSAGLDFETKLFAKTNAAALLRTALAKPGYVVKPIGFGTNTDPYQPIEQRYRIMRELLEVLVETRHPLTIVTKSARIERDLDLLTDLARDRLVRVYVSVTSLDNTLSSRLEPRASAPHRRLRAIESLAQSGVPVGVMVAPVIPMITDQDLEEILARAHAAGASSAAYVMLRLPYEVKDLFREWLALHFPARAAHVMSLVNQLRGGRDYDSRFGTRMKGEGVYAELIARRFAVAAKKHGFDLATRDALDSTRFRAPRVATPQGELF